MVKLKYRILKKLYDEITSKGHKPVAVTFIPLLYFRFSWKFDALPSDKNGFVKTLKKGFLAHKLKARFAIKFEDGGGAIFVFNKFIKKEDITRTDNIFYFN